MPAESAISCYYRQNVFYFMINYLIKNGGYSNEPCFLGLGKIIIVKLKHLSDPNNTAIFNWTYIDEGFELGPFGSILST